MNLNEDSLEVWFNTRLPMSNNFVYVQESNLWHVLELCKFFFACYKGISLVVLDQLYTSSIYEFWLPDKDQCLVVLEPTVLAPYPDLEILDTDPIWENNVADDIVLGFPLDFISMENGNTIISRNTG